MPAERFDTYEHATPRVDSKSLATVRQNQYSLPVRLAGLRVAARIGAREIIFCHDGREVARHERLHGRFGTSAQLDHYLELLRAQAGALARSLALRQEREHGRGRTASTRCGGRSRSSVGASEAARQMVDVLLLCREHRPRRSSSPSAARWRPARIDGRAVQVLARRAERTQPGPLTGLDERLAAAERPAPDLAGYDQLLDREAAR